MFQKLRGNTRGFTLIELMIVITIIGILSAIAIPNFISYRNKAFCSETESDVNAIAAGLADYFSIGSNFDFPDQTVAPGGHVDFPGSTPVQLTNRNSAIVTTAGGQPLVITIIVTDGSKRCPIEYQAGVDGWSEEIGGYYKKVM